MNTPKFQMDKGWLEFHPNPSKPKYRPPAGAVDAHCHVFGPGDIFPYAPSRKYTPCDAPKQKLWELRDFLGLTRNVIVQATCHGTDNRALVDAMMHSKGLARGVASISLDISDKELNELNQAGVRGVRFNFVKRLVDVLPLNTLQKICERIQPLGWHLVVYCEPAEIAELSGFLAQLPGIIVFDHMTRPDVRKEVMGSEFNRFVSLLEKNENMWAKVSCPDRLSLESPSEYKDVIPFAKWIVDSFPDRVLWGTDWPHPNLKSHMPDDGHLVNYIPQIATTEELQKKLLIDNPMRLYWPELV